MFGRYRKLGQTELIFCVDCKIRLEGCKTILGFILPSNELHPRKIEERERETIRRSHQKHGLVASSIGKIVLLETPTRLNPLALPPKLDPPKPNRLHPKLVPLPPLDQPTHDRSPLSLSRFASLFSSITYSFFLPLSV